jgi:GDP-4-dehydro-6-deoxy-D-mannose reductase
LDSPVLVTGADGFVGKHLRALLADRAVPAHVDVRDASAVAEAVHATQPGAVVHLAAESSVASSWEDPRKAWSVNVTGTVNVLEAVREESPNARVLFVSTGEIYGRASELPTPETAPAAPLSPYAATKAAAEIACGQARHSGTDVVVARAFTTEGPGRDERFALGSWAQQIAQSERKGGGVLEVGNLAAERDITDVRDVCRAYTLLLDDRVAPGTYNVASGRSVPLSRILDLFLSLANVRVEVVRTDDRLRPADIPSMVGDASRLRDATGWKPEIPLEQTLADMLHAVRVNTQVGL